mmetsp:Transcript_33371/g.61208  ORF Transcript_33371/g.61208 Transcript_33371/m.61208 type:complete len:94 (-) Transcript_33371:158-439(-)
MPAAGRGPGVLVTLPAAQQHHNRSKVSHCEQPVSDFVHSADIVKEEDRRNCCAAEDDMASVKPAVVPDRPATVLCDSLPSSGLDDITAKNASS